MPYRSKRIKDLFEDAALLALAAKRPKLDTHVPQRYGQSYTKTKTKRKTARPTPKIAGRRRRNKIRRVKPIKSSNLKVPKKFRKKVLGVLNETQNWGKYNGYEFAQLRQSILNQYNAVFATESGEDFSYGSAQEVLHLASVLFNGKTDGPNWNGTLAGNLDDRIHVTVESYNVDFFFKSTSSHVVNIEMYECTVKQTNAEDNAYTSAVASYNNSNYHIVNNYTNSYDPSATASCNQLQLGSDATEWLQLHAEWTVRKRTFKLLPGDWTTCTMQVCRKKVYDFSKYSVDGVLGERTKGTKQVFFRILNDPTISKGADPMNPLTSTGVGTVNHWPSNAAGGVALRVEKKVRIVPPKLDNAASTTFLDVNTINRGYFSKSQGADQQVVFYNPIADAEAD